MSFIHTRPIDRAKVIVRDEALRLALKRGVDAVAGPVRATYGPGGRSVVVERPGALPVVTTDGDLVASTISVADRIEDIGARLAREAAHATSRETGDGATTATILAQALVEEGLRAIAVGVNAMLLRRGIEAATARVVDDLRARAAPVSGPAELQMVATSVCGDPAWGALVGDSVHRVGVEGQVRVQPGHRLGVHRRYVHAMQLDQGWVSARLITDRSAAVAAHDHPVVFVTSDRILDPRVMAVLLQRITTAQPNRPVAIVALEYGDAAIELLTVNVAKGAVRALALRAPGIGRAYEEVLQDLAAITGAAVIPDLSLAFRLGPDTIAASLGSAARIVAWSSATLVESGRDSEAAVSARAAQIRHQIARAQPGFDRRFAEERLARLTGRVAVLEAGAPSDIERQESIRRLTDTVAATKSALASGVVPGGGIALAAAGGALGGTGVEDDMAHGVACMARALVAPLRQLAANAGYAGDLAAKTTATLPWGMGLNVRSGRYEDLRQAGVIDPVAVLQSAVVHGASAAAMILTTNTAIHYAPQIRWPPLPETPSADA